jgi:hypothetical protein
MMPIFEATDVVVVESFLQDLTLKSLTSVTLLLSLVGSTHVQAASELTARHKTLKLKTLRLNFIDVSD